MAYNPDDDNFNQQWHEIFYDPVNAPGQMSETKEMINNDIQMTNQAADFHFDPDNLVNQAADFYDEQIKQKSAVSSFQFGDLANLCFLFSIPNSLTTILF